MLVKYLTRSKMPREKWKSVSLPIALIERIEETIKEKPNFWSSKADFIKYAVRRLIELNFYKDEGNREEIS